MSSSNASGLEKNMLGLIRDMADKSTDKNRSLTGNNQNLSELVGIVRGCFLQGMDNEREYVRFKEYSNQQCAAEAFGHMAKHLEEKNSGLVDVFKFGIRSKVTCGLCSKESSGDTEPYEYLSCQIPPEAKGGKLIKTSVKNCFDSFFKSEKLSDDSAYHCQNCGGLVSKATKKYEFAQNSEIFVVHLKRYRKHGNGLTKIHKPTLVDNEFVINNTKYKLKGVVLHSGSLNGGHYISLWKQVSKSEENQPWISGGEWFASSDNLVKDGDELFRELQSNGVIEHFDEYNNKFTPSLLFYERENNQPILIE
jgi:ubiquitin C-terminal hydrolase